MDKDFKTSLEWFEFTYIKLNKKLGKIRKYHQIVLNLSFFKQTQFSITFLFKFTRKIYIYFDINETN